MGLKEGVLRGIYGHGFVKPSPIQQKGILPVIQGKDTIAQVTSLFNINHGFRHNQVLAKQDVSLFLCFKLLILLQSTLKLSSLLPPESLLNKSPTLFNRSVSSSVLKFTHALEEL